MSRPKISVIVPVYKAEAYLCRCVDSILSQTFEDFELLLIDDGSPDRSGEICDEYAKRDCRVRVFHKENGGVSSARQCGLDHALGEYVIHADPDDWMESEMLCVLYNKVKERNSDIALCDFVENYRDEQLVIRQNVAETPRKCIPLFFSRKLHGSCCNKLIRRSLFIDNYICFPKKVNLWEDLCTISRVFWFADSIVYINKPLYHYSQYENTNSYTKNITIERIKEQECAIKIIECFFQQYGVIYDELNFQKLLTKIKLIYLISRKERSCVFGNYYKEANDFIWRCEGLSLYNKLILWLGCNHLKLVANIMIGLKPIIKKML